MTNRLAALLTCLAVSAATGALAQTEPSPSASAPGAIVAPLTVQGAESAKTIQRQAYNFVQAYAAAPNPAVDQYARWHDPVCVVVVGLPQAAQAEKIKARIEGLAQTLGLRAPKADCKPNVEILFTDQPQDAMTTVAKLNESVLGYDHAAEAKQPVRITRPIQAWYVTGTQSDGVNTASVHFSSSNGDVWNGLLSTQAIDERGGHTPTGCLSRFTACYKSTILNVIIVADNKALAGNKLSAVADDMAMLALSQPRSQDGCYDLPSIIDRFAAKPCEGRDPPDALTATDNAYLNALYAADPEARKAFATTDIAARMAKMLIKSSPGRAEVTGR